MLGLILAAGKGTRLQEIGKNIPKALLPLGKKTCFEHIIIGMKNAGITRVGIVIGHLGEQIIEKYGKGDSLGVEITYLKQDLNTYGTARAVQLAENLAASERLLVSYGDIIVDPDNYKAIVQLANETQSTISSVNFIDDPSAGAAVYLNAKGYVERIIEKPVKGESTTNWNNAGIYAFQPIIFDYIRGLSKSQRGEYELTEAVRQMVVDEVPIKAHKITGYWRDIGRPEDLLAIQKLFENK